MAVLRDEIVKIVSTSELTKNDQSAIGHVTYSRSMAADLPRTHQATDGCPRHLPLGGSVAGVDPGWWGRDRGNQAVGARQVVIQAVGARQRACP